MTNAFVHVVALDAFAGDTDDERMAAALDWAACHGEPVVIDKGDAVLTEISVYGLPDVTFVGDPL